MVSSVGVRTSERIVDAVDSEVSDEPVSSSTCSFSLGKVLTVECRRGYRDLFCGGRVLMTEWFCLAKDLVGSPVTESKAPLSASLYVLDRGDLCVGLQSSRSIDSLLILVLIASFGSGVSRAC